MKRNTVTNLCDYDKNTYTKFKSNTHEVIWPPFEGTYSFYLKVIINSLLKL